MATIPRIAEAIRTVLTSVAETIARPTGFVRRASKLTGSIFAQATVLGWLKNPEASMAELAQVSATLGVEISPQGLDERFGPQAAAFLEGILNAAVTELVASDPVAIPLLQRFSAVLLQDSSTVGLPRALAGEWAGCGNQTDKADAALKLQVRLDVLSGTLYGPVLEDGKTQDKGSHFQHEAVPAGALRIADLGYFGLGVLQEMGDQGAFFLSRLHTQTAVFDPQGKRLDLLGLLRSADRLDMPVLIGVSQQLPVRLLALRVPEEVAVLRRMRLREEAGKKCQSVSMKALELAPWTILVTNAPAERLSLDEALVVARVRWQIELLFKLWKSHGKIDEWRSGKPWRILCEVYAKLTAMIVQHWLILTVSWRHPDRSLVKAAATIRSHALMLILAMAGKIRLTTAIEEIAHSLTSGCRMNPRKKAPNTYQLLLNLKEAA